MQEGRSIQLWLTTVSELKDIPITYLFLRFSNNFPKFLYPDKVTQQKGYMRSLLFKMS